MPLVAHAELPSLFSLRDEGSDVRTSWTGRTLNIGLLNLMPDSVLEATERQWMRLCSAVDDIGTVVHPVAINELRIYPN